MTSLVTGANGFIGSWLVDHLRGRGDEVIAGGRAEIDVLNPARLKELLSQRRPDCIYHLAAQSLPGESWKNPAQTHRVNVVGTTNLLEAVRAAGIKPVIVVACSSSQYATSTEAIREDFPMDPLSPYAVSKLAVDHAARLYAARYDLNIVRVRPFFLIGPRKRGDVCSDIARRVVDIENGRAADMPVGRLEIVRDFLDVRDGAVAIARVAERGRAGDVYNVCSGLETSIGDIVSAYQRHAMVPFVLRPDPALVRPLDEPKKVGDNTKLRELGWAPAISFDESIQNILEYWRCKS